MASHTRYYIFVYHDNAYVSGTIYFFFYKLYDREVLPLHPPPPTFFCLVLYLLERQVWILSGSLVI